ncbi:MAG: hypothetical protein F4X18_00205 [Acidimicrobiia bacterium]|nr:hypothetical protein [Acidimicrobiia bacterium]
MSGISAAAPWREAPPSPAPQIPEMSERTSSSVRPAKAVPAVSDARRSIRSGDWDAGRPTVVAEVSVAGHQEHSSTLLVVEVESSTSMRVVDVGCSASVTVPSHPEDRTTAASVKRVRRAVLNAG